MPLPDLAYMSGVKLALARHNVPTAAGHQLQRRLPFGPDHLGAERLAKALSAENFMGAPDKPTRENRLERVTQWGNPTSLEAGNSIPPPPTGLGHYAGV